MSESRRTSAKFGRNERKFSSVSDSSWITKREVTLSEAVKRVLAELNRLGAVSASIIISTNVELRLDGLPRSGQRKPVDPGVAVYWKRHGTSDAATMKVMAVDRYDRVEDNLAAIAATIDAMRAIERHGGAQVLERAFTGFTALAAPSSCWDVLGIAQGSSREDIQRAFREKAAAAHPDAAGGSHDAMVRLNAARDESLRGAQ